MILTELVGKEEAPSTRIKEKWKRKSWNSKEQYWKGLFTLLFKKKLTNYDSLKCSSCLSASLCCCELSGFLQIAQGDVK